MPKKLPVLFCCLLVVGAVFAQESPGLIQLKKQITLHPGKMVDSSVTRFSNRYKKRINYLMPLYIGLQNEKRIRHFNTDKSYYDNLSDYTSFIGDYPSALYYATKSYETLDMEAAATIKPFIDSLKKLDIQHVPAQKYILNQAAHAQVTMINEAHSKPLHRAFTISLLQDMYKLGYRYLAMEALNNTPSATADTILNVNTGFFINEPVCAEMVRIAKDIGYTVYAYEDTMAYKHSGSMRDSIQAVNIYKLIQQNPSAKILVHAGYGHISEEQIASYIPMAMFFKKISGINPLTVNQTDMTEGSDFAYGRSFYEAYLRAFPITVPSVAVYKNKPVDLLASSEYDISIIHPPTNYKNKRPDWYSLEGIRKELAVKPTEKSLFLVQAYYYKEYNKLAKDYLVPADQTYTSAENGYYYLYLQPGKYKIVMRDIEYKVLSEGDMEMK